METFLLLCHKILYQARKNNLDLNDPKVKKALCYTLQKELHEHLFITVTNQLNQYFLN